MTSHGHRILVLDGIRGFALCMVLVQHFFQTRQGIDELHPIDRAVFGLVDSGWWAIDSFFVLSAFLITGILIEARESKQYFLNFYVRRTLRIFPLYYATLFVFFVLLPLIPHPLAAEYVRDSAPDQAWFWTYLTNFQMARMGDWYDHLVPTVFWSLAVEEHFYLIWPLVVFSFTRTSLMRICMSLFVAALGFRVALALSGASPVATFVLTPARMDCLALGSILALIRPDHVAFDRTVRAAKRMTPFLALGLVLLALPHGKLDWRDPLTNTLGFAVTALMCGGILLLAVNAPPSAGIRRLFEARGLLMLGKYSYAMYIFHGPAATLVKGVYDFDQAPLVMGSALPLTAAYSLAASLVTLAVAWLSWNLFERHFLKLQRRFRTSVSRSDPLEATDHNALPGDGLSGGGSFAMDYMHRRFTYAWLASTVGERGFGGTLRSAFPFFANLARLWWWDKKHNVSTRQRVFTSRLGVTGPTAAHAMAYEATGTTVLPRVLPELKIRYSDYVFVDLGAGKGQALFHAAEFPLKRIVGLELSRAVYEVGLRNCRTFRSRTQACRNVEILHGDAADFAFPDEPLVIYLFNSFDEVVLARVLERLADSLAKHPRDVLLIYHNPRHRDVVASFGMFDRVFSGTDTADFRKVGYEVFRVDRSRTGPARGTAGVAAPGILAK